VKDHIKQGIEGLFTSIKDNIARKVREKDEAQKNVVMDQVLERTATLFKDMSDNKTPHVHKDLKSSHTPHSIEEIKEGTTQRESSMGRDSIGTFDKTERVSIDQPGFTDRIITDATVMSKTPSRIGGNSITPMISERYFKDRFAPDST